ncbi:XdhC family protein [Alphaproteobacteria bacterium]|nr:XdhC family protein [Alphaproteobacteria bacterium]
MTHDVNFLLELADDWQQAGHKFALAFVMQTWGSSPRQAGSIMLIRDDHHIQGSVSGGCVEGAVIEAALAAQLSGKGKRLDFGIADETAWNVGLSCGGSIAVLVCPIGDQGIDAKTLTLAASQSRARETVCFGINARTGKIDPAFPIPAHVTNSQIYNDTHFIFVQPPPARLIVVGGVHIAQHLIPIARRIGLDVTLIDPRSAFANETRFTDCTIIADWPESALKSLTLDAQTAMVTLTHDPKIDDDALIPALASDMFYIAALGSRRTHAKRIQRLSAMGCDAKNIARIHAPAGLDIGSNNPADIAISILAELIARRNGK